MSVTDKITFSFGENWQDYLLQVSEEDINRSQKEIVDLFGAENINNKTVIDIGCGSGIHSLVFLRLKAASVVSFDYDQKSVEASKILQKKYWDHANWKIVQASVLDKRFMDSLGRYDIVYSWGVLHHTGKMWEAVENCLDIVKPGGFFLLGIYGDVKNYQRDLKLKQSYNAASGTVKKWMIYKRIIKKIIFMSLKLQNPLQWNEKRGRGMNYYNDLVDWLGGLPYEVASEDEVVRFFADRNFVLKRLNVRRAVFTYLFKEESASLGREK
jgi:2-polyprenyl-6-hydroxyphenyl methylase/3-demethylubiquinone-9 3-methyltransferase